MPIVKIENINEDCTWGLWKIDESIEELSRVVLLSDEEKSELEKINYLQRKKEWLAARVILKLIVERSLVSYAGIRKDNLWQP